MSCKAGLAEKDSSEQIPACFFAASLPFLAAVVILFACAPIYITEKRGGSNAFVAAAFFVANSEEPRLMYKWKC